MAAINMMPTSASLIRRINMDFSYLSASCPALAENRKKGRMNKPAARLTNVSVSFAVWLTMPNVTSTTSAFLNRLSLKAPRNWVTKKGPKRRCFRRSNCDMGTLASPLVDRRGSL